MGKTIFKGINKETGLIDAELKQTPVLITELIYKMFKPGTSLMDIYHDLEDIRKSAEQDQRIRQIYVEELRRLQPPTINRDCPTTEPNEDGSDA